MRKSFLFLSILLLTSLGSIYIVHAAPFSISVTASTLVTLPDANIPGSMSGATYQAAGFVGPTAIDLKATVLSFTQNNGTGTVIFAKSGDDPSVRVTSGHAIIKWEVFEAGTSIPAYGDVDFTISDIDAYSIQNLGGAIGVVNVIPKYPIESVSADLTGLFSYTTDTATNISFTNDGTKIKAANLISNQNGEPQSNVKFSWKNISSWQLNYDVENPPLGPISYDQSPYDSVIDGTFTLTGFGQRFFNNDADGDLVFLSPLVVGLSQLDLDNDNSTASGTSYINSFSEGASGSTVVDTDMILTHASSSVLHSATITLVNKQLGDVLSVSGLPALISATSYDPLTGILTLSGVAPLGDYETVLKNILFNNTTENPDISNRTIQISVSDGVNNSDIALSTIQVTALNDTPTTTVDNFVVVQNIASSPLDLLGNDSDVDGDTLTIKSIEGVLLTPGIAQEIPVNNGTVYVSSTGVVTFLSNPNFSGGTTFSYVVQDQNTGEASGTANLEVLLPPAIPTLSFSQNPSPNGAVTITGTGTANTTIEIQNASGSVLCSTTVSPLGEYTCGTLFPAPLTTTVLTVYSCDPIHTFNCSEVSDTLIIDDITPLPPTLANPTTGLITNNPAPIINGTGEIGSVFEIRDGSGTLIGTGIVDAIGNYSYTPTINLSEGVHTLSVTLTDAAGNTSMAVVRNFTVDTTAPTPLTIISPISNSFTNNTSPTINGTGEIGSIFEIRDGSNTLIGTGIVDVSGNYTYTPPVALLEGSTTLSVVLIDTAGNVTTPVNTAFTIDATPPVITLIGTGSITQEALLGYSDAGATWIDTIDGSGSVIASGSVNTNIPGMYTLSYDITDRSGNIALQVLRNITITAPICPIGRTLQTTTGGIVSCEPCQIGYYNPTVGGTCIPAPVGFFVAHLGSHIADFCPAGSFTDVTGSTICQTCPSGYSSGTGAISCLDSQVPILNNPNPSPLRIIVGQLLNLQMPTCSDNIACTVTQSGSIDTNTVGTYTFIYIATDAIGNTTTQTQIVEVLPTHYAGGGSSSSKKSSNSSNSSSGGDTLSSIIPIFSQTESSQEQSIQDIGDEDINRVEIIEEEISDSQIILEQEKKMQREVNGEMREYTIQNTFEDCPIIDALNNPNYRYTENIFLDTQTSRYPNMVDTFGTLKIAHGNVNRLFEPLRNINRAEFTKMVLISHCYQYQDEDTKIPIYKDLIENTWEARVVSKAQKLGIINGYNDETFKPEQVITKAEATKILMKMAEVQTNIIGEELMYKDISVDWHKKYVQIGETLGVFNPDQDTQIFRPDQGVTREDMVDMIHRVVDLYR